MQSLIEKQVVDKGCDLVLTSLLQKVVPGSKAKQQVEANLGSKQTEIVSEDRNFQDENSRNHKILPAVKRVGHLPGLDMKDMAWADSELYRLGPVVAEQQLHP